MGWVHPTNNVCLAPLLGIGKNAMNSFDMHPTCGEKWPQIIKLGRIIASSKCFFTGSSKKKQRLFRESSGKTQNPSRIIM
jgi:hypothetical protein